MSTLTRFLKNPVVLVGILAIAIRLAIAPFLNCSYDDQDFGQIVKNMQVGFGIYGLDCYYYTPVWGYIVGLQTVLMDFFLDIPVLGERFTDLLQWESVPHFWLSQSATLLTPEFTVVLKVPIIIADILVGIVMYKYLMKETGDQRKALIATSLWLLFPTVIVMSSMKVMFDSMPALLFLLTFVLLKKDMPFVAGLMYSTAILLKFFPLASAFVILAYLLVKHKGDGKALSSIVRGLLGMALAAIVIYLPVFMNGEFMESIKFVTMRTGWVSFSLTLLAIIMIFLSGILMYKTPKEKADKMLPIYLILPMVAPVMMRGNPNYMIAFLPLLFIVFVTSTDILNKSLLKLSIILLAVSSVLTEVVEWNFTYLVGVGEYFNFLSIDTVISWFTGTYSLWGGSFASTMQTVNEGMQFIGQGLIIVIIMIAVIYNYKGWFIELIRRVVGNDSKR